MNFLEEIDASTPEFGDLYDELPLWSAPFGRMLLESVPLRRDITILDVGCGTGFLSIELAQRCGGDVRVIAVDPWAAAIARLLRKLEYMAIQNVRAIASDVAAIDLPDASVDLIVSNLGINNFENHQAAFAACYRVARPGASLFLATNLAGHMDEFYDAYRITLAELGFTDRLAALDAHVNHRATIDSMRVMLQGAGFEFVDAVTRTFRERFVDGTALLRHYFVRLGFLPAWKDVAPPTAVEQTMKALERRLNLIAAQRGELSLTIPAACVQARKPASA